MEERNNDLLEIKVYTNDKTNIFTTISETDNDEKWYEIPLYQREYAWDFNQIEPFLEDIFDINPDNDSNYHIGNLIVADQGKYYEVVDGQQRLTTLFLLMTYLGWNADNEKKPLRFACRSKSEYTLYNIKKIVESKNEVEQGNIQSSINEGYITIQKWLASRKDIDFSKKLRKVVMYRIVVPKHTDLNRYFETMNTRGEQLEKHDILKAKLMSFLNDSNEKEKFAAIWDACSNMDGYVQMNFKRKFRDGLFGPRWNEMKFADKSLSNLSLGTKEKDQNRAGNDPNSKNDPKFSDIIKETFKVETGYEITEGDDSNKKVRFESIINFPYFLLHCLKVYVDINDIQDVKGKRPYDSLLDDKKLSEAFKRVIEEGREKIDGAEESKEIIKSEFAQKFIMHLLKIRFLFDKYIIKREYIGDDQDGDWSLKEIATSGSRGKKSAHFNETQFTDSNNKENLMIQSALRVSYTSPKVMHWITKLLYYLAKNNTTNFLSKAENIARYGNCEEKENKTDNETISKFLNDKNYTRGVETPHIVFNYLDYLIWKKDKEKYRDFRFEFRNSVEHWYPQHPMKDEPSFKTWDHVDTFGNLCIVPRNINSKFSNLRPEGKKESFKESIEKGSLKLHIMSEVTINSESWLNSGYSDHEKEMLDLLKEDCKISIQTNQ